MCSDVFYSSRTYYDTAPEFCHRYNLHERPLHHHPQNHHSLLVLAQNFQPPQEHEDPQYYLLVQRHEGPHHSLQEVVEVVGLVLQNLHQYGPQDHEGPHHYLLVQNPHLPHPQDHEGPHYPLLEVVEVVELVLQNLHQYGPQSQDLGLNINK